MKITVESADIEANEQVALAIAEMLLEAGISGEVVIDKPDDGADRIGDAIEQLHGLRADVTITIDHAKQHPPSAPFTGGLVNE